MLRRPPLVMGYDLVGEIDQLGSGVSGWRVGDRVADLTVLGCNAAWRILQARHSRGFRPASTARRQLP